MIFSPIVTVLNSEIYGLKINKKCGFYSSYFRKTLPKGEV
jgi:hypothetical protein